MWTCNDIRQRSAAYFANELAVDQSQTLEQHLASCAKCRLELSEAYSAFRLASAAFNAPDAVGGLNAARLGVIYAAVSGGVASVPAATSRGELRRVWFAAAASAIVAIAAWMGQPLNESLPSVPLQTARAEIAPVVVEEPLVVAESLLAEEYRYPASFGLIYPSDFRAAGGYTPDSLHATVTIDYDSVTDQSLFIYDPAYGMGRTVVSDGARSAAAETMSYYGLDGPKRVLRL